MMKWMITTTTNTVAHHHPRSTDHEIVGNVDSVEENETEMEPVNVQRDYNHHSHHPHRRHLRGISISSSSFFSFYTMTFVWMVILTLLPYNDNDAPSMSLLWFHTTNPSTAVFVAVHGFKSSSILRFKYHHHHHDVNANRMDALPSNGLWWLRSPTLLSATMYLPDDWVDDHDDWSTSSTSSSSSSSLTIPSILQSPEWVAPLARIAAEYTKRLTPTIGHINVQQIEHVSITKVAPSHVDIEAIVCENDACVSLSVPVPFTQPCLPAMDAQLIAQEQHQQQHLLHEGGGGGDTSFEDCVIRNIQALDTVQLQEQATAPATTTTSTPTSSIMDVSQIEYPSWWIYPGPSLEFAQECQSLLQVLNEPEFQREITILVTKELYRMLNMEHDHPNNIHILQIQSAVAVAVGPSGMIFRVMAMYEQQLEMVDVPIPFSTNGLLSIRNVNDPVSLRNAVLYCIEHVIPL